MNEPKPTITPEQQAAWVANLRSGKFPQIRELMRTDDGNCCLGVLCATLDIPVHRRGELDPHQNHSDGSGYTPVAQLIGMKLMETLQIKNDIDRLSFPNIADFIEARNPAGA